MEGWSLKTFSKCKMLHKNVSDKKMREGTIRYIIFMPLHFGAKLDTVNVKQ